MLKTPASAGIVNLGIMRIMLAPNRLKPPPDATCGCDLGMLPSPVVRLLVFETGLVLSAVILPAQTPLAASVSCDWNGCKYRHRQVPGPNAPARPSWNTGILMTSQDRSWPLPTISMCAV